MDLKEVLTELMKRMGNISMYKLGRHHLKMKSFSHVWHYMRGDLSPSIEMCYRIMDLCDKVGMKVTLDMLNPRFKKQ